VRLASPRPRLPCGFHAVDVRDAFALLAERKTHGKIVLIP
jgi:hypothetical protein